MSVTLFECPTTVVVYCQLLPASRGSPLHKESRLNVDVARKPASTNPQIGQKTRQTHKTTRNLAPQTLKGESTALMRHTEQRSLLVTIKRHQTTLENTTFRTQLHGQPRPFHHTLLHSLQVPELALLWSTHGGYAHEHRLPFAPFLSLQAHKLPSLR